jgi:hypothetical protein
MSNQQSATPRQDYLRVTRDFATALQTHIREFEDHPDLFDRDLLQAAYRTQASMVQQHFAVLSILYDREFPNIPEVVEEPAAPASSLILP